MLTWWDSLMAMRPEGVWLRGVREGPWGWTQWLVEGRCWGEEGHPQGEKEETPELQSAPTSLLALPAIPLSWTPRGAGGVGRSRRLLGLEQRPRGAGCGVWGTVQGPLVWLRQGMALLRPTRKPLCLPRLSWCRSLEDPAPKRKMDFWALPQRRSSPTVRPLCARSYRRRAGGQAWAWISRRSFRWGSRTSGRKRTPTLSMLSRKTGKMQPRFAGRAPAPAAAFLSPLARQVFALQCQCVSNLKLTEWIIQRIPFIPLIPSLPTFKALLCLFHPLFSPCESYLFFFFKPFAIHWTHCALYPLKLYFLRTGVFLYMIIVTGCSSCSSFVGWPPASPTACPLLWSETQFRVMCCVYVVVRSLPSSNLGAVPQPSFIFQDVDFLKHAGQALT